MVVDSCRQGAWSDGSSEWTPSRIKELNQTDEDDGKFWMTYEDFLRYFNQFAVCRLLTDDIGKLRFCVLAVVFA